MKFSVLSSGSGGNATLVTTDTAAVLIDCGVSLKSLKQRADSVSFDLTTLSAVVVTHEHNDHAGNVAALARRYGIPVYLTHGTALACGMWHENRVEVIEFSPHSDFSIGDLRIKPTPVPHDAREPCQFVIEDGASNRLGILTDIGSVTPHVESHFRDCRALILEFNHDVEMLHNCAYPDSLKARVGGRFGHFSNDQAKALLEKIAHPNLDLVIAAHLSENSNSHELVQQILQDAPIDASWRIAEQHQAMSWVDVR
ncbi:MAG: MBL fold metallo-hydrolase [Gammaproteobacteria bacterium]